MQEPGVARMEEKMDKRPGYAEYRRRVSAFVPWPKKKSPLLLVEDWVVSCGPASFGFHVDCMPKPI